MNELRKLWQGDRLGYIGNQRNKLVTSADFYEYARVRDDEFSQYLKESWHDYSILETVAEESRAVPDKQPVFDDFDNSHARNLSFSKVVETGNSGVVQIKSVPGIRKPESYEYTAVKIGFRFYGQQISIDYDRLLREAKTNSVSEDSVSGFWKSFSRSNSNRLVDQLVNYRHSLGLSDWGYFQLVKAVSFHIFNDSRWSADLLSWALMVRSGFDMRIAFNQNSTSLLFASENVIFSRQYVLIGQKRFYLDRQMNSPLLVTFNNSFPDAERMIDLKFYKSLNFGGEIATRRLSVTWRNKKYEIAISFNPNAVDFYHDYPKTEPEVYFGAPVSAVTKEDLIRQLCPIILKMDKTEAVAFLQYFVQTQFNSAPLQLKDNQFNGCFTEEVLSSNRGDDRAKAVLFSWLIRNLVQLPAIGVHFPGYYSAAVSVEEPLEGDYFLLNRKKYFFTDPTFQNAPIGLIIPEFRGLSPQLIDLTSEEIRLRNLSDIWRKSFALGAMQIAKGQDVVFDREGRAIITGYLAEKRYYTPFVACFSRENSLQWIRKFEGDGKAVTLAITKVSDDEIYLAGSFSGSLMIDGTEIQSTNDNPDLFITQFDRNGKLIWMQKVGIDTLEQAQSSGYLVKFDRSGENISVQMSNEDAGNIETGFGGFSESGLWFACPKNFTPGLAPSAWSGTPKNISGEILKEEATLLMKKCHPKIAGFFAVMKLLQKPGSEVTGLQIQTVINQHNFSFQHNFSGLFRTIGQVERLYNENGVITIQTVGNHPIIFRSLRISSGARFNLSGFDNNDLLIHVISGFSRSISQISLTVNSLFVDYSSGDFILDYDYDHTQKTVSLDMLFSLN